jgi:MFS family permease
LYLTAQFVSVTGTAMGLVGLTFAVLQVRGRASDVGIVLAAAQVPGVLLLIVGGVAADRVSRRALVLGMDLLEGVCQAATAAAIFAGTHSILLIAALQVVGGSAGGIRYPALTALIGDVVGPEEMQEATALRSLGLTGSQLLGGPLAGLLVAFASPAWALLADAGSFGVSVLLWTLLRPDALPPSKGEGLVAELRGGVDAVRSRPWLVAVICQFTAMIALGFAALEVLGPVVARRSYGGATAFGWMLGAQAVGSIAGGILGMRWRTERGVFFGTASMLLLAPVLVALALDQRLSVVLVGEVFFGVAFAYFAVVWYTALREQIPPDLLGRVIALDALGSVALYPVGLAGMGWLAGSIGLHAALWLGVAGTVIPTAAALCVPEVRRPMRPAVHHLVGTVET